jgi:hypothetical protein
MLSNITSPAIGSASLKIDVASPVLGLPLLTPLTAEATDMAPDGTRAVTVSTELKGCANSDGVAEATIGDKHNNARRLKAENICLR